LSVDIKAEPRIAMEKLTKMSYFFLQITFIPFTALSV